MNHRLLLLYNLTYLADNFHYTLGSPGSHSVLHSLCSLDINSTLLLTLT